MSIFDPVYSALADIGFHDPLHPALTHFPIALVFVALMLWAGSLYWREHPSWRISAQHCLILAWLFFFPTVLLGYMDWQHYYHGVWIFAIKAKIALAIVLFILLSLGLLLILSGKSESRALPVIYALGTVTVVALGYFGGHMVYSGRTRATPQEFHAGMVIYDAKCSACHPNGGNAIIPSYPIKGSQYLETQDKFIAFIRNPRLTDGSKGPMQTFPPSYISDQQGRELYRFLIHEYALPAK